MKKPAVRLSFIQRLAVHDELKKHCTTGPNGVAIFAEGWDDHKVAEIVGAPVTHKHVASIRRETIGDLIRSAAPPTDIESRLTQIEDYLTSKWPDWKSHVDGRPA